MVWRDRFWVQQGEERKKIDTLLHQPRGKETQPWLVIVFLLYFDGRTVNGLIRRLLSKKRNLSREKKEQKVFLGFRCTRKRERKSWLFPRSCIIHWGPRFLPFSPPPLCFLCVFLYSFFLCSYVGKAGCNVGQRGEGLERRQLLLCQVGYLNRDEESPSFQGLKRNNKQLWYFLRLPGITCISV